MNYWRIVGEDHYSCVAPPGYEIDPAVTAAIREFDPGVIPFWRIQLWIAPGETQPNPVVHHGIARYYPYPRHLRRQIHFDMPAGATFEAPNFLDLVLEDIETPECRRGGGPGGYLPWDWGVYYWCRRKFDQLTLEAYEKLLQKRREREAAARKAWEEELEYRKRQIEPWILRKLETVSDSDWKAYLERGRVRDEMRRQGLTPERLDAGGGVGRQYVFVGAGRSPRPDATYGRVAPAQE